MKPLSGLDGAFLHLETPETPMHVGSLHLFDLPPRHRGDFHADIKRLMGRRLHAAPVFQRKLSPMPLDFANPAWIHDDEVDLDWHVQRVSLAPPGGQTELEDCVAGLHAEPMDRSRPLWRIYVIDGLASGQAGYYFKVHHAVLDGQAGVLLAQALFDVTSKPRAVPRTAARRGEHPGMAALAAAALKHDAGQYVKLVRHLPDVVRTLGGLFGLTGGLGKGQLGRNFAFGPRTPLNVPITGERRFSAVSLPIDALRRIAVAHDAKLNDIVLALCSGVLRRYLAHHGGVPSKPLIAAMPISLREPGNTEFTTQATMALVNLHTHVADPIRRLHAIRDAAAAVKALAGRAKGIMPTDFPSIAIPWLMHGLATLYGKSGLAGAIPPIANLVISNVPGPQVPLYAAGARMHTYWPLSIPEHGVGLNITVMSYAGAMGFGFVAARNAVPDTRQLARALEVVFEELLEKSTSRSAGKTARRRTPTAVPAKTPAKKLVGAPARAARAKRAVPAKLAPERRTAAAKRRAPARDRATV